MEPFLARLLARLFTRTGSARVEGQLHAPVAELNLISIGERRGHFRLESAPIEQRSVRRWTGHQLIDLPFEQDGGVVAGGRAVRVQLGQVDVGPVAPAGATDSD